MWTVLWALPVALRPLEHVTAPQLDVSPVHLFLAPKLTHPASLPQALLTPFPAATLSSPPVLTRLPAELHVVRGSLWNASTLGMLLQCSQVPLGLCEGCFACVTPRETPRCTPPPGPLGTPALPLEHCLLPAHAPPDMVRVPESGPAQPACVPFPVLGNTPCPPAGRPHVPLSHPQMPVCRHTLRCC